MRPSRASTFLTGMPLARPPILGLQLISLILAPGQGASQIKCQGLYLRRVCLTMRPSRASTSLTRVPLARPPMLGLQLISPMLDPGEGVTRSVCAPLLAAAAAASQPACTQESVP